MAPASSPMAHNANADEPLSPRAVRARLEEAMGKLDRTEEEATPLVIDDLEEGVQEKWLIAGKVLHRKILHIQTIANALRPPCGNPRGLTFKPGGGREHIHGGVRESS